MNHYIEYERWIFTPDKIKSGNIYLATSLLSSSLEVNSFSATVECGDPSLLNFRRNTKLLYYAETGRPMVFRVQSIERVAPKLYKISATSTLGLLTEGQHYGGIYTGETALEVIASICGTVPFEVKTSFQNVKLYGWLPIAAPRDNLAQVLFAIGATLKTDLDGVLRIEGLWDGVSRSIGSDRMYQESSVKYEAAITSVVVTEHQYIRGSEVKSLYEGDARWGDIITFSEPMHDLTAEGFTILDQGANWAKLSAGVGALWGSPYIHNTREVVSPVHDELEPNVKTVKDATLISFFNSDAVANRLKNYYRHQDTISAQVVYQGEQPGDKISVYHPFDRTDVASVLQSVDLTLSNTIKAQEKSLVGLDPERPGQDGYYDARTVILESGDWTVPDGVFMMRVVLIGGGKGGEGGHPGETPSHSVADNSNGYGGTGGAGGAGGMIYQFSIDVTPGDVYSFTIGVGGDGGVQSRRGAEAAHSGGHTTMIKKGASLFDVYTSIAGASSSEGFTDAMTGEKYAIPGASGIDGGNGGDCATFPSGAPSYAKGQDGEPAKVESDPGVPYLGGIGGRSYGTFDPHSNKFSGGGGGGGGAFGQRGEDGGNGTIASGGRGGNGGTPVTPGQASMRGAGGQGGHGGGGGGYGDITFGFGVYPALFADCGAGGNGSPGGKGGDGVAIIYYQAKKKSLSGQFVTRDGKALLDKLGRRFIA